MKLQLVDYQTANDLKELGFDWPVTKYYNHEGKLIVNFDDSGYNEREYYFDADSFYENWNDGRRVDDNNASCWGCTSKIFKECYSAPEQALVVKWLRDVHKLDVDVSWCGKGYKACIIKITPNSGFDILISGSKFNFYDTFEESELEGIKEVIKYLKDEMGKNTETS